MTFYEAALEVLRRAERPLHYKKITEIAIRDALLSHRGKTPEITMNERLLKELRREEDATLERTRPGVYQIREDLMEGLHEAARIREEEEARRRAAEAPEEAPEEDVDEEVETSETEETQESSNDSRRRRSRGRRSRRGRDEREERDNTEEEPQEEEESSRDERRERGGRGRSRRGRGRRSRRERDEDNTSEEERPRENTRSRDSRSRDRSEERSERRERGGRGGRGRSRNNRPRPSEPQRRTITAIAVEELAPIAQAAYQVLRESGKAMQLADLTSAIQDKKLATFPTGNAAAAVRAALANANQERRTNNHRQLFDSLSGNAWGLTDWGMSDAALSREKEVLALAKACQNDAVSFMDGVLATLPPEGLEHIAMTLLDNLGYYDITVSKRGDNGDIFFYANASLGLSHKRVCIQLNPNEDATLSEANVAQVRGSLHQFAATEAIIIHMGSIDDAALTESSASGAPPVAIIDRDSFLTLLLEHNIGVRRVHTPIYLVDPTYFDQLRGS